MSGGRPIRVLNVAEKPSVAKSVAGILSGNSQGGLRVREGRSRYNKVFEFTHVINGQPCQMLFTSVTGHLMELEFEDRYRKWHSCDPVDLYQAPVRKFVPEDKKDIKKTLEEEARHCQWLILWLDCDREGENIAFEVVEVCTGVNRQLNIWRARFSALTDGEIHQSVQNLDRPNRLLADAVDARQEIDLRIGASFTRFQTMLLKDAFVLDFAAGSRSLVLSYGPCQFPTLGFIVERYWEIQSHEPEEFWTINCSHNSDEGTATFNWSRGHLFDYTCAIIIYEMCIEESTATVTKVHKHERLKHPPHPLSTIELEKRASRYFRMSSDHTMKVAEDLYQAGFISYPRTETDSFSQRTDLRAIVQEQQGHPVWGSYAQRLLDSQAGLWRNPSNGGHDDKAHPPIHPTKFSPGENGWSQDHHRLYELVVRHFLACVSMPAVGGETVVDIDIAGELFSASGRVIIAKNYLDVYRFESWGGSMIPTYDPGQQFIPTTLTLDSGHTRAPPLLSEADLLNCMDKAGIGTDATMHDHIKKLLDRFYATKNGDTRFSPTNLGEALVMGYDDMGYELWKPYLRSMMECDMKAVGVGTKRKAEILETCLQQMKACFLDARSNKVKLLEAMSIFFERTNNRPAGDELNGVGEVVRRCGVCRESNMILKRNRDGKFMVGCTGFPQCRNVVWLPGSVESATVTTDACNACTPGPVFRIQFKFRRVEIPPNYNADHMGCIGGCDETLRHLTEICGTGSRTPSVTPASGRVPTASSSSSVPRNNSRQACIHCRQTGHSSTECPSQNSRFRAARPQRTNSPSGEPSVPCTTCGAPCILRTASTASNNGRKFYSCQSRECKFFLWEDSMNESAPRSTMTNSSAPNASRRGGRGGRSRNGRSGTEVSGSTFVSATGEPVAGSRSCYVCGDPSHFANACPNRDICKLVPLGRYEWRNGNSYVGRWRSGLMHGEGAMIWTDGNRYNGNWEGGLPKGSGTYTRHDHSFYVGNWSDDPKDQSGTYYPVSSGDKDWDPQELFSLVSNGCKICPDEKVSILPSQKIYNWFSSKGAPRPRGNSVDAKFYNNNNLEGDSSDVSGSLDGNLREVGEGLDKLNVNELGSRTTTRLQPVRIQPVKREGVLIAKGHKNYDLMINLQLGVRHTVGKSAPATSLDLKGSAFSPYNKVWTKYPCAGSKHTLPHTSSEFKWKDYCPDVFRTLRELFQVDPADYMLSICGNAALREISSQGKSGSLFYLTDDDKYMIKTVKKAEAKALLKMLQPYFNHVRAFVNTTLITKFYGLHCVKPTGAKKVRFVIMGNLFCSKYSIHRRYDLKGSSYGRTTDRHEAEIDQTITLKDLDLNFIFRLQNFQDFCKQVEKDCEFLEQEKIMDYSMLVGIHFCETSVDPQTQMAEACPRSPTMPGAHTIARTQTGDLDHGNGGADLSRADVAHGSDHSRQPSIKLGVNMPAMVEQTVRTNDNDGQLVGEPSGEHYEVILYLGIIDILQDYDISKKLEHAYKSIQHDPTSISAVDPKQYSKRFRDFIFKVFTQGTLR